MANNITEYLNFAIETVLNAGKISLGYFQVGIRPEFKADDTPVTVADRKVEEFIRQEIEKKYPTHEILGEEFGASSVSSDFRWIVDPIDGTKSFINGVPLYAVLLALEIEGACDVGVAYFPALNELVYAAKGSGCYLNGKRVQVRETESLSRAVVSFTDSLSFSKYGKADAWERVQKEVYYRVGWSDAYGHALVATGRLDVMLDPIMNPWDCAPFIPILKEAGGYFGDWQGNSTIYNNEAISCTASVKNQLLALIAS